MITLARCLVKMETRANIKQESHGYIYTKVLKTARRQIIWNFRKFVKRCFLDKEAVKEHGLSSAKRLETVMVA